jgi:predicted HD superfamily hydrolase involved in NAD metabolism
VNACASWHEIRSGVRNELSQEYRYRHSVLVARTADRLAQAHGIDPRRARCAGILHDIARLWPTSRLLDECRARSLAIDDFERDHPIILHARIGAALAAERFGVNDEAILSAIRKHTVGDAVMTPLDAVIFIADGLEPGRDFPDRVEMLDLALHDLDAGLAAVYASTRLYLAKRGLPASPALLTTPHITKG